MSIQKISKEQLRRMGDQEGLILQGCGGDPQEWLDGINQILTEEGICGGMRLFITRDTIPMSISLPTPRCRERDTSVPRAWRKCGLSLPGKSFLRS